MAIAVTREGVGAEFSNSDHYVTSSHTFANDTLYIVDIQASRDGGPAVGNTQVSGAGMTWVLEAERQGLNCTLSRFRAMATTGSHSGTLRFDFGGTIDCNSWIITKVTGVDTSGANGAGAIRQNATGAGHSLGVNGLNLGPLVNGSSEALVAAVHFVDQVTTAPGTWVEVDDVSGGALVPRGLAVCHRRNITNCSAQSWATTSDWHAIASELVAGVAPPPPPNPLTAHLVITPSQSGLTSTQFTASGGTSTTDGTHSIKSYSFDWDDGTIQTGTATSRTHTYAAPGTYNATLTVDDNVTTDVDTKQIKVTGSAALTAVLSLTPPSGVAGTTVFTASASGSTTDGSHAISSWSIDWGDGVVQTGQAVRTHTYGTATPPTKTVTLTVGDGITTDSTSKTVTVTADGGGGGGGGGGGLPDIDLCLWCGSSNTFVNGPDYPMGVAYEGILGRSFGFRWNGGYGGNGYPGAPILKSTAEANHFGTAPYGWISTNVKINTGSGGSRVFLPLQDLIDGNFDAWLHDQAADINSLNPAVRVRIELWSEANVASSGAQGSAPDGPWVETGDSTWYDTAHINRFRDWCKHIVDLFDGDGCTSVDWVLSLSGTGTSVWSDSPSSGAGIADAACFIAPLLALNRPGVGVGGYIDIIGVDSYNKAGNAAKTPDGLWGAALNYARQHNKKLGIFETGHNDTVAGKAAWYGQVETWLRQNRADIAIWTQNMWEGSYPPEFNNGTPDGEVSGNASWMAFLHLVGADFFNASTVTRPTIASFTPTSGPVGTVVQLTGTGLNAVTSVLCNGKAVSQQNFTVVSDTQISLTVNDGGTGPISVRTATDTVNSSGSFALVPVIAVFNPVTGPRGTSVVIAGTGFTQVAAVRIGTPPVAITTYTVNSTSQITATIPQAADTGRLTVQTSGGSVTSSGTFTVTGVSAPVIADFTPKTGPIGTSVVITGQNLTGVTSVTFNNVAATFTVNSNTQITATVPSGA